MTRTNVKVPVSTFYPGNWAVQESDGGEVTAADVLCEIKAEVHAGFLKVTVGYCSFTRSQTRSAVKAAAARGSN